MPGCRGNTYIQLFCEEKTAEKNPLSLAFSTLLTADSTGGWGREARRGMKNETTTKQTWNSSHRERKKNTIKLCSYLGILTHRHMTCFLLLNNNAQPSFFFYLLLKMKCKRKESRKGGLRREFTITSCSLYSFLLEWRLFYSYFLPSKMLKVFFCAIVRLIAHIHHHHRLLPFLQSARQWKEAKNTNDEWEEERSFYAFCIFASFQP
jgi:hypothetical protein